MASPSNLLDSSFSSILKQLQEGTLSSQLANHSDMWKYITKSLKKVALQGKKLIRPLKVQRGIAAVKNIAYNGSFASKKTATLAELIAEPKYITAH